MSMNSTKPYLIRSIYDWCIDSGFTPYVSVKVSADMDIPMEYVKDGEIIFNIGAKAVQDLMINNETLSFNARFNGISQKLDIPLNAIKGIFAKEVNQGIAFPPEVEDDQNETTGEQRSGDTIQNTITPPPGAPRKPKLRVIK